MQLYLKRNLKKKNFVKIFWFLIFWFCIESRNRWKIIYWTLEPFLNWLQPQLQHIQLSSVAFQPDLWLNDTVHYTWVVITKVLEKVKVQIIDYSYWQCWWILMLLYFMVYILYGWITLQLCIKKFVVRSWCIYLWWLVIVFAWLFLW